MSMRKLYLLFALCFAVSVSNAQRIVADDVIDNTVETPVGNTAENPVGKNPMTFNVSLHAGMASIANHYMSANSYDGMIYGMHVDFGRFYKSSKGASWNLAFDRYSSENVVEGLVNDAKTSSMSYKALSLNFSSFYNWMFGKGLTFKLGGGVDVSGDLIRNLTHPTNNAASLNVLAQLEVAAGLSYTFQFEKWMLALYGNVSTPFGGMVFTDAKHESGIGSLSRDGFMNNYFSHIRGVSFTNLKEVDFDLGVKFIARRVAIDLGIVSENRYWYVNDIQNSRTNMMFRLGATFNLVSLEQTKTIHRYF